MKRWTLLLLMLPALLWAENHDEQRVYLAAYQSSGSRWLRELIEEASGIASFLYVPISADGPTAQPEVHWEKVGYCLEGGRSGRCRLPEGEEPILVHTHYPNNTTPCDEQPYKATILLIRDPRSCIRSACHHFAWQEIPVKKRIRMWRRFYKRWEEKPNVHLYRYEDLCEHPRELLTEILELCGYKCTPKDVERALVKHPPHTSHHAGDPFFSWVDRTYLECWLLPTMRKHHYSNLSWSF